MAELKKTIGILSTMDTKGKESGFLKNEIEKRGFGTFIIDVGVMGEPQIKTDLTREEIARAGGKELEDLIREADEGADRADATEVMIQGVKRLIAKAHEENKLHALVGLGGSTGSSIALEAMRELPADAPRLMLTTVLDLQDVENEDNIALFQSPCDILGLNSILKNTLSQTAGTILGMLEAKELF
jgi:uncharacterized protein (UPF0261 family)